MRNIKRTIEEVREERGDLSSWLVHLTKDNTLQINGKNTFMPAKQCLENIIKCNQIVGVNPVGQFNYKSWYNSVATQDLLAICLTETPIHQIYLFTGIKHKALTFSNYGLVFSADELAESPVYAAPVMYFSQPSGSRHFLKHMNKMEQNHYNDFREVLYLFDKFGKTYNGGDYNFRWEREWRIKESFQNIDKYIKFGLCPESDIDYFESLFKNIPFVDPFFNPNQITKKLSMRGVI